jgi:hypothetical protein
MSYPSGSTLLVALQNGASPNTGPFDIYINDLSSSTNLIANDVSKATLSGSGYTFVTPLETFTVWAKSDGLITNADVVFLGNIPGTTKNFAAIAAYDSSLNAGLITASVFLDNGYGLQSVGAIPASLNACPPSTTVGTSSIVGSRNTLIVVKTSETGSEYIRFFANTNSTSDYFYHIPSFATSGTGGGPSTVNVCVDLSGGGYQTVATNSINVYPTASLRLSLLYNNINNSNAWNLVKVNGSTIYSSSLQNTNFISVPGNALVEVTSSIFNGIGETGSFNSTLINLGYITYGNVYNNALFIADNIQSLPISPSGSPNTYNYGFYALPGANYNLQTTASISGDPASATLTFQSYVGNSGGSSQFNFNLDSAIPSTNITISSAGISAFTDPGCTSLTATDNLSGTVTLTAGTLSASGNGTGGFCSDYYSRVNFLNINGNSVSNGSTITIGGTQVTISIPSGCNVMPCIS